MSFDSFSDEVWFNTYKDHGDKDKFDTFKRVARGAANGEPNGADVEKWSKKFESVLSNNSFVCAGRIYSNCGTEWGGTTLMNCFVGPRSSNDLDSLDGILKNLRNQAFTLKSEGGWGDNFSYIRPRGSFIAGVGAETPGAVKYMELFDKSSEIITSGSGQKKKNSKAKNKIRKGAMMGVLDVWHPDIVEFIRAKQSSGRLSKFNISVNCTDKFMEKIVALKSGDDISDDWDLIFPDTSHDKYETEWFGDIEEWQSKGYPIVVHDTISASWLWDLLMQSTYNRNDPGILFLDRANHYDPSTYLGKIFSTNPCGEQTLRPGDVCDLGSLNLVKFVTESGEFDFKAFKKIIPTCIRFLDNINTISNAPLPEYVYSMRNRRRVGLGVLGWGSLLFMLKIRFASDEAHELREKIMKTLATEAYKASIDLAIERGMFDDCNPQLHAQGPFVKFLGLDEEYMQKLRTTGIRNSSLLSIQPTGNTSIFAGVVSGGGEPIFMPEYIRTVIVSSTPDELVGVCPKWEEGEFSETKVFKFTTEGDEQILRGEVDGVVYKIDQNRGLTKEVPCEDYAVSWLKERGEWDPSAEWAVTTTELTAQEHIDDMTGFAKYLDSAMSKTINVPNEYSFEDFENIYLEAFKTGYIKGLTTYRAGTMTTVLSSKDEGHDEEIILDDVKLPDSANAQMKTIRAAGKKWYLTLVYTESMHRPFALFVNTNSREPTPIADDAVIKLIELAYDKGIPESQIEKVKSKIGGESNVQKVARLISFLLRHGVLIKNITIKLDKVEDAFVGSFVFHIKKFLQAYIKDGEKSEEPCLECGSKNVVYSEGCFKCNDCGASKCG